MQKDEALALPASRELDAIVAQEVMGWSICFKLRADDWYGMPTCPLGVEREIKTVPALPPDPGFEGGYSVVANGKPVPHYSESIEAAWQVVEKLKDHLPELVWRCGDSEPFSEMRWWCYFRRDQTTGPDCHGAAAETAPLAICRAAIKVVLTPPDMGEGR